MNVVPSPDILSIFSKKDVMVEYFSELYLDLITRLQGYHLLLQFSTFHRYLNLPMIISEKLFVAFNVLQEDGLTKENFIDGFKDLYCGTIEKRSGLIFRLFDFDSDGYVNKDDILLIFSRFHIPPNRIITKALKEIIFNFFGKENSMSKNSFMKRVLFDNSDPVRFFIILIRQAKIIHEKCLIFLNNQLKEDEMNNECEVSSTIPNVSNPKDFSDLENFPKPSEILITFLRRYLDFSMSSEEEELQALDIFEADLNAATQNLIEKSTLDSFQDLSLPAQCFQKRCSEFDIKLEKLSFFVSRSTKFQSVSRTCENKSINDTNNEWTCYIIQNGVLSRRQLVLVEEDLFCFVVPNQVKFFKIYNLRHSFIKKCELGTFNHILYHPAAIVTNATNPELFIFFDSSEERENFIRAFKIVTNTAIRLSDKYEVHEQIGKGQYGKVFQAINKKTHEKVAIKLIKKTPEQMQFILTERDVFLFLTKKGHPNIVRAIEHFETENKIYFIYEFLQEGNLSKYLMKQAEYYSTKQILDILNQVGSAIEFLHENGIVHRDIKPENILIEKSKNACVYKLIDFGFAKTMGVHEITKEPYGTFYFAAPEIVTGTGYNHTVDIWSFGVFAYYLKYGRLPCDDDKKDININNNYNDKHDKENKLIMSLIKKCLVKDSSQRSNISQILILMSEFFAK